MSGGRISQRTVEAVKARADIVELFEARMGPGRRGSGQVMFRCPFHDENTASCRVHPTEKTFHCFGCGEGGDVIHYVRQLENLSFTESVEWLADRYGVEVEREDLSPQERERYDRTKKADGLLEDVAIFYQRYLETADEAEAGRAYLVDRGITHASVQQFRLGFAPSDWERTTRAARERGYADQLLIDAGVAREGQRGLYDWFRGRVIFPLCDARGRVRGFGARVLPGGEGAKYINSPESEIFKKGRILYGLDQARVPIARAKRAIVVEGYTDVIQLHAAGFPETVAAMGTSLTDDQVRELRRLTDRVVLCFDADAAGQEAALRGMGIAELSGLRVQIATLPAGQDPADLIASGPEAFEAVLADTRSVLAFRISRLLARIAEDGADAVYGMVRQVLSTASPGPERDEQVRHVASVLRLSPDSAARPAPRDRDRVPGVLSRTAGPGTRGGRGRGSRVPA